MTFSKIQNFKESSRELAAFAKAISHPARIEILKYLAKQKKCISGNITDVIPLSRTTVSQHLQELKKAGLIIGNINGVTVNYCLCRPAVKKLMRSFSRFMQKLENGENTGKKCCS